MKLRIFIFLCFFISSPLFAIDCQKIWTKNQMQEPAGAWFIPHELWLGVRWDGLKKEPYNKSLNNFLSAYGSISGPNVFKHPILKKEFSAYKYISKNKKNTYYYYLAPTGISVLEYKKFGKMNVLFSEESVYFPAGSKWRIGVPRFFTAKMWEGRGALKKETIIAHKIVINQIVFNSCSELDHLIFTIKVGNRKPTTYTMKPERGVVKSM